MIALTEEQVLASATTARLVNIVSAPGSGKTTVAAERFGYKRYGVESGKRGILGLSFTRSASSELASRISARWGSRAASFPHTVSTFDQLHVRMLHSLVASNLIRWPSDKTEITVLDDYRGCNGYRWLTAGNWQRTADINSDGSVISSGKQVTEPRFAIGRVDQHNNLLHAGIASHEDVRSILLNALQHSKYKQHLESWFASNYREVIIDEIYDADELDLSVAHMAVESNLGITLIGDPRQALYGWRGATPDKVEYLINSAPFTELKQSQSFRFHGDQMPALTRQLRAGDPVTLPIIASAEVDVALSRRWADLWSAGDNVLPLAYRSNVGNGIDAMINLLLDIAVHAHLGRNAFGRYGAIMQLGLDGSVLETRQQRVLAPILGALVANETASEVLDQLRDAALELGARRRPIRLKDAAEHARQQELEALAVRLRCGNLVPGLTVHQAKGCEWNRVGVVLTSSELKVLSRGLRALEEDDCVIYVALTRAKYRCGLLSA